MKWWQLPEIIGLVVTAIIAGVVLLFKQPLVLASNIVFFLGMFALILAAFFILSHAQMFVGWRRIRRRGEDEDDRPKIKVSNVASEKNGPIIIGRYAKYTLRLAATWLILAILISL